MRKLQRYLKNFQPYLPWVAAVVLLVCFQQAILTHDQDAEERILWVALFYFVWEVHQRSIYRER